MPSKMTLSIKFSVFIENLHIDDFYLISQKLGEDNKTMYYFVKCDETLCDSNVDLEFIRNSEKTDCRLKVEMDGYLCSLFYSVLHSSLPYKTCFINNLSNKCKKVKNILQNECWVVVHICIVPVKQDVLDYKGNEMFEISCLERRELDHTMAWLSTLGGAFSALGDSFESCAATAGKISLRQLEIALRLGDPFLIARCKLYMALSLIQRHKFKKAEEIIRAQYVVATQGIIKDIKLKSMCLGIWAKLKYDRKKAKAVLAARKN